MLTTERPKPVGTCRCGYPLFDAQTCPECGLPFRQAISPARPRRWLTVLGLLSIVFADFILSSFRCACGYLSVTAIPFTLAANLMAWSAFAFSRERNFVLRAGLALAVIAAFLLLATNLADVLWLGHNPLLP